MARYSGKLSLDSLADRISCGFVFLDPVFQFPFQKNLARGAAQFNKIQTAHGLSPSSDLYHYWPGDPGACCGLPGHVMPIRRDAPDSVRIDRALVWQGTNFSAIENLKGDARGGYPPDHFTLRLGVYRVIKNYSS